MSNSISFCHWGFRACNLIGQEEGTWISAITQSVDMLAIRVRGRVMANEETLQFAIQPFPESEYLSNKSATIITCSLLRLPSGSHLSE
jgi:hypothetical protein